MREHEGRSMAWLSELEAQPIDTCISLFDIYQESSSFRAERRVNTLSEKFFPKVPRG